MSLVHDVCASDKGRGAYRAKEDLGSYEYRARHLAVRCFAKRRCFLNKKYYDNIDWERTPTLINTLSLKPIYKTINSSLFLYFLIIITWKRFQVSIILKANDISEIYRYIASSLKFH